MATKKFIFDNSRVQDSLERAALVMTDNETGRETWIRKLVLNQATEEERDVFWKFCNDPMTKFIGQMEVTDEELVILIKLSTLHL